jgi:hypothetical protein
MKFCRNTPDAAKRMLEEIATEHGDVKHRRIINALASDDRMEEIWKTVAAWPDAQISHLTHSAFLYAMPGMLADLILVPQKRGLGYESFELSYTAKSFADAIEKHRTLAEEFWPESSESVLPKLREFSERLYDRWFALWTSIEDISAPSRRGLGDHFELAYGNAITHRLEQIGGLSRERQDVVVAVLTNVVFSRAEGNEVQAETIKARRRRKRKATQPGMGDKSGR